MVLKEIIGGSLLRRLTTLTMCAMWTVTTLACTTATIRQRDGVCPLVALKPGVGVELENEIEIADAETIAENPQNYYGKKVSNYTAGGQTYRIFYVDKQNDFGDGANTVYLKADYNEQPKAIIKHKYKFTNSK